jgi:uncharacterized protein DUF5681
MTESSPTSAQNPGVPFRPDNPWQFQKGVSGNPGGKPKKLAEIVDLARSLAPDAIRSLHEIAVHGRSERARIEAAVALLDRGLGKPKVTVESDGDRPILHRIEKIIVRPPEDPLGPYEPPSLDDVGFRIIDDDEGQ